MSKNKCEHKMITGNPLSNVFNKSKKYYKKQKKLLSEKTKENQQC